MNKEIYFDFDGVLLDTQVEIDNLFRAHGGVINEAWNKYLANDIDWIELLNNSKVIDDSLNILKALYVNGIKTYVFSRVFSLRESQAKLSFLRDNGVKADFIICPGRKRKSEVIIPNKNRILVEDSKSNAMDWKQNNGVEIFFTKDVDELEQTLLLRQYIEYMQLNNANYLDYLRNIVNGIQLISLTVTDDTKKDLIALRDIEVLNQMQCLDELSFDSNTLNCCSDLSVFVKKRIK